MKNDELRDVNDMIDINDENIVVSIYRLYNPLIDDSVLQFLHLH